MNGLLEVDDFLDCFDDFCQYAKAASFADVVNPVDGVVYPHICKDIPDYVVSEVSNKLSDLYGSPVCLNALFMRMSPIGAPGPHQCHTDNSMGSGSFMLYMNKLEDCQGGTAMVYHIDTGIAFAPVNPEYLTPVIDDMNNSESWVTHSLVEMKPNRAAIFPANSFHRAEPVGGFGDNQSNARLVLTGFFN